MLQRRRGSSELRLISYFMILEVDWESHAIKRPAPMIATEALHSIFFKQTPRWPKAVVILPAYLHNPKLHEPRRLPQHGVLLSPTLCNQLHGNLAHFYH